MPLVWWVGVSLFGAKRMFFCLLSMLAATVSLAGILGARDEDPDAKPWVEGGVEFPAFPEASGLIEFRVGWRSDVRFFVDGATISVGGDEVIRYVLVVVSARGAKTISYEGMRCETAERRAYAFGRADGSWSKSRSDRWVPIRGDSNNHYVELYASYFCANGQPQIMTPEAARRVLSKGGNQTSGF
jgi:hypothetical protein